jgi:hypothetical protein
MIPRRLLHYLIDWKSKKERKPLVLRGARQVGKTFLLKHFGQEHFTQQVYLNLENPAHLRFFNQDLSLEEFKTIIQVNFDKQLIPGKTLLFIDEIQNSPALVKLLRFFYEQEPQLHVVAAGSLLEAKLQQEGFSLPVGRIEFAYLHPLDFFEFLLAQQKTGLHHFLLQHDLHKPIPAAIHQQASSLLRQYAMIGGMPELVSHYARYQDFQQIKKLLAAMFTTYLDDLHKYASTSRVKYLRHVLTQAPNHAGKLITFQNFAGSNYRYREMSEAFLTLEKVMLVKLIAATSSKRLPLQPKRRRPHKLLFLDLGFTNYLSDIFQDFLLDDQSIEDMYQGRIAEQLIGQNVLAQFEFEDLRLYYWAKERREGSAEVDFTLVQDGKIFGLEVKAGTGRNLKSLNIFGREVANSRTIRFYSGNIAVNPNYHSFPLYLAPRIKDILELLS